MKCYVHKNKEAECACVNCGKGICSECNVEIDGKSYCKKCVVKVAGDKKAEVQDETVAQGVPASVGRKNPLLAAFLSLVIPGLGQAYNGQLLKGIAFFIIQSINAFLIFILIGLLTVPLFWLYTIWDAYATAKRINGE